MRIFLTGFMALLCLTCPSCKNEETTLRDNMAKTWRMYRVFLNGSEVTPIHSAAYTDYRISFTSGGEFTETYLALGTISTTKAGSWSFYNDLRALRLQDGSETRYYDIEKLEDDSFILLEQAGTNLNRYELVPE